MKKVEKGEFGYLAYKKSRNMIKTIIAFAVVLVIFIIGFIIWKSKNNYLTMLAVVLVPVSYTHLTLPTTSRV